MPSFYVAPKALHSSHPSPSPGLKAKTSGRGNAERADTSLGLMFLSLADDASGFHWTMLTRFTDDLKVNLDPTAVEIQQIQMSSHLH